MSISENREKNKIDIREIERTIFSAALCAGRSAMAGHLEELDDALAETRDKKRYRDKGRRRTVLKTMLGEVEFSRRVYVTEDDVFARTGGDEFSILLPLTSYDEAIMLSHRIIDRINEENAVSTGPKISISVGAATKTSPAEQLSSILQLADLRMYENKRNNSNPDPESKKYNKNPLQKSPGTQ